MTLWWIWGLDELVDQLGESSQLDVDFDQGLTSTLTWIWVDPCKGYEYALVIGKGHCVGIEELRRINSRAEDCANTSRHRGELPSNSGGSTTTMSAHQ